MFGGGNKQPKVPKDMGPMRSANIGLLNYLLGFPDAGGNVGANQRFFANTYGNGQTPLIGGGYDTGYTPGSGPDGTGGQPTPPPYQPPGAGGGLVNNPYGGVGTGGGTTGAGGWGTAPGTGPQMQANTAQPTGGSPMMNYSQMGQQPIQMAGMSPTPQTAINQSTAGGAGATQFPGMSPIPSTMGSVPYGKQPGGGFSSQLPNTPAPDGSMLGRMESYFGPMGTPTTALQQQSLGGISQFLNSNPYGQSNQALTQIMGHGQDFFGGAQNGFNNVQDANYFGGAQGGFNQLANGQYFGDAAQQFKGLGSYNPFSPAQGMLEGMFQNNPGMGVMNAMHPMYERALAEANQQGGRFGSANAILRSRALDDYSLQMQQAMQRGVDQQLQGAGVYGSMGNSLLQSRNAAGQGLLGVGQGQMQQQNAAAQGLLGVGQGQLSQGLGAAQGMLGVGQGRSSYDLGNTQNQLGAAGQMANNANSMFNNTNAAYQTGSQQATQEAERQKQALAILLSQLGVSQQATLPYQDRS